MGIKKSIIPFSCLLMLVSFGSCRNKTVLLLTKTWDCVQVDNILPPETKLLSPGDTANNEQLKELLRSLSWTFKKNMGYVCALNGRVTVEGKYELLGDDRILVCRSNQGKTVNRYIIKTLTEHDLILNGSAGNTNLTMHFKPR